ncbi:hypothetical protein EHQ58_04750 [Leptospira ognonensis]|uniref:DUF998 domain-containing protein n=1 Tax=Leptospira ognonensis TaxID=2484945 RepID=A0A4R9K6L7_9LEPT|nr:hypothetical protein [Leptospira ognonensis]TGL61918.1 hypothetical protein EHQ58_04750 [Leptospira ognonensis]
MKKIYLCLLSSLTLLFFANCQKLDSLLHEPALSPEQFLASHHWTQISFGSLSFILDQPSSTFFVYFLSLTYLYACYVFWKAPHLDWSKKFWSLGFLFTGIAAILAGTSYQALGYELKCEARAICKWTTWWEINYEILQNIGMNGFLAAGAFSHATSKTRRALLYYAVFNSIIYACLVLYGALTADRFLVSFEFLELSCLPSVLFFLVSTIFGFLKKRDSMNFHLMNTWLFLVLIMISYVTYMELGLTSLLWERHIWFSENDVLHVGLIVWVFYIVKFIPEKVRDKS